MQRFLPLAFLLLQAGSALAAEPLLQLMAEGSDKLEFSAGDVDGVKWTEDVNGGSPKLHLQLDQESSKLVGEFTTRHLDKPVALMICGSLVIRPVVREPILNGGFVLAVDSASLAASLADTLESGTCR